MGIKLHVVLALLFLPLSLVAGVPGARKTNRGIELQNKRVSILISDNAELLAFTEIKTGVDIASHNHSKVARAILLDGHSIVANKVSLSNDVLHLFFGNSEVQCKVIVHDNYFLLEVVGGTLGRFKTITFVDYKLNYDYYSSDPFIAAGVSMNLQTDPVYYPSGESKAVSGRCTAHTGIRGSQLAVVACKKKDLRSVLKEIYNTIPVGNAPVSHSSGGPFALDNEVNKFDCVLMGKANPSMIPEWISLYSKFGIRQFEFQNTSSTFIQGQFSFPDFESAAEFKEQVTDPLYDAGIISTLHTFSYYISPASTEILSNPIWQQQLEFREIFTLSENISSTASDIHLSERVSFQNNDDAFHSTHTVYALLDNEIITYSLGSKGFVSCKRGRCGTSAESHRKGSKIKIIGGYYSHIAPQIGSDLYYEIARRTAKAYNEGGFRGLYFDALSGLPIHLKYAGLDDYVWYYGAAFVNEVLKYCSIKPDVVDISNMYCTLWPARSRGITWDPPTRGYKNFIDEHLELNRSFANKQYVTTLGWYKFYPVMNEFPSDYSVKYMFSDDVDYIGVKSIAFDQMMIYSAFSRDELENNPALKRNMILFANYSKLRQSNYFSDRIIDILKKGVFEYRLEKRRGIWGFREAFYSKDKIRDITKDYLLGQNPFKKQKPFIRLENGYTSIAESSIPLFQFNESSASIKSNQKIEYQTPLDLSEYKGIKVTLRGNGVDSPDAICVRLGASLSRAYADFIVRLNFDGWRDIVLPSLDNADFYDLSFPGMEDNYIKMHQSIVDLSKVTYAQLFLSKSCSGVDIRKVEAVPVVANSLSNPEIHLGSTSILFKDTIQSGEYIEYKVGDKEAYVYDHVGNYRSIKVSRRGRFRIPQGDFNATITGKPELRDAPSEVILTFGLFGNFISN